ncbi:MAG: hypothetical protein ACXWUP_08230, partial [Allosphingosinicella sp.]
EVGMASYIWRGDSNTFFYIAMAWVGASAAVAGFSTTYFIPLAGARFEGPAITHIHGLLFFGWITLLIVQTALIRRRNSRLHRRIGLAALPLAAAMAISGAGVGIYAVRRDLAVGMVGDVAHSQLIGVLAAMLIFVSYVSIALAARKHPDWHKRMMVLATIAVLWPAWFRFRHFMPWIPRPEISLAIVVADAPILVAMVRDG